MNALKRFYLVRKPGRRKVAPKPKPVNTPPVPPVKPGPRRKE